MGSYKETIFESDREYSFAHTRRGSIDTLRSGEYFGSSSLCVLSVVSPFQFDDEARSELTRSGLASHFCTAARRARQATCPLRPVSYQETD
jgi:hypothetical protein